LWLFSQPPSLSIYGSINVAPVAAHSLPLMPIDSLCALSYYVVVTAEGKRRCQIDDHPSMRMPLRTRTNNNDGNGDSDSGNNDDNNRSSGSEEDKGGE
jgi:hypothetical protein